MKSTAPCFMAATADHRDVLPALAHAGHDVHPVAVRQLHIEQDEVGQPAGAFRDRRLDRLGHPTFVPLAREGQLE